jgi:gliding motility-associated-like protein
VVVTDGNGCTDQASVTVSVNIAPVAAFEVETDPVCEGINVKFTNLSTNADTYSWDFGDGETSTEMDPEHTFAYGANFTTVLTAISAAGCTDTASYSDNIKAFEDYFSINIPNVFTPNNDGVNDRFELNVQGTLGDCIDFRVFNRWGQLMFVSQGNATVWDGYTSTGIKVPAGTYFYVLSVKGIEYKGNVTVLE